MTCYIIQYRQCKTWNVVTVRGLGIHTLKEAKLAANKIARQEPIIDARVIELKEVHYPDNMIGYPKEGSIRVPVCGKNYRTVQGDYNASGWYAL